MNSEYRIERLNSNCKIAISGSLTAILVPELNEVVQRMTEQGVREVVFDLRDTRMLDSSGIGMLIASRNNLSRRGGMVRVINTTDEVFDLLSHLRLVSRLHVSPVMELQ
jgi:anti-anti-sigma factor